MLDSARTPATLKVRFEHFSEESAPSSPLYCFLSKQIPTSDWMLALLTHARPDQPAPNLLFGTVHFLLQKHPQHPLANFYPSLTSNPLPLNNSFQAFVDFCQEFESAIKIILNERRVQTNEVARSAILLPAISFVSQHCNGQPLSIIELGASAGLNMLWDHFHYRYENEERMQSEMGPKDSQLQINTHLKGSHSPNFPQEFPIVHHRIGIDLNPLDPKNTEDQNWLKALIWPEHAIRRQNLENAFNIWAQYPQEVIQGNAVEILPEIASLSLQETPLLILSSLTLYQFSEQEKQTWAVRLRSLSLKRQLFQISLELEGEITSALRCQIYEQGDFENFHLANSDGHATTLEWLIP